MHLVLTERMSNQQKLLSEKNRFKSKFCKYCITQTFLCENLYFFSVIMHWFYIEITSIMQKLFSEKNALQMLHFCENKYFASTSILREKCTQSQFYFYYKAYHNAFCLDIIYICREEIILGQKKTLSLNSTYLHCISMN